jgi:methyl-accepting chemotaxis protein
MTIKTKLVTLIASLIVAFIAAIGLYFLILSPVDRMAEEEGTISELSNALYQHELTTSALLTDRNFSNAMIVNQDSAAKLQKLFERVKTLKTLANANDKIRKSLDSIGRLQALIATSDAELEEAVKALDQYLIDERGTDVNMEILSFSLASTYGKINKDLYRLDLQQMMNKTEGVVSGVEAAISVINRQTKLINKEIAVIKSRSVLIAFSVMLVILGSAVFFSLRLTNGIARSVYGIESMIRLMKNGDLTHAVTVMSSDEIGKLSANLGDFQEALKETISRIQGVSAENISMKDSLVATAEEASASGKQMFSSGAAIGKKINTLDTSLGEATAAVQSIANSILGLNGRIQSQMAMVEQSTASVTQMIASIENVAKITEQRSAAIDGLSGAVADGGDKLGATFDEIQRINQNVGSIQEITGIIAGLSSQTNLLAMNAAIEAAHAGEAGKGFSVVADEIRKLAEASANNSKEIGQLLNDIVERIDLASRAGTAATSSYKAIDGEVKGLKQSLTEIFSNMSELRTGGDQILESMTVLREESVGVKEASVGISENAGNITSSMGTLKQVSTEVSRGMAEISQGIDEISQAMRGVLAEAEKIGQLGVTLNDELSRFKTEDGAAGLASAS